MCAEASTVLRAIAADFFSNCWYLEILSDNRIRYIPRCVHYHAQGFRLETFYNFFVGSLMLVESFDFRPSNQYILVRVIPSCFRFAKLHLWKVSLPPRCSPRYLAYSLGGGGGVRIMDRHLI
jgi:hypothetical protein